MRLLADENFPKPIVDILRTESHEVCYVQFRRFPFQILMFRSRAVNRGSPNAVLAQEPPTA